MTDKTVKVGSTEMFTFTIHLYPDGDWYPQDEGTPSYKSDDYETRLAAHCPDCDDDLIPHYGKPFASCRCKTTEWYL